MENSNNLISKNLYVAGLASGVPTMFSCASGDGAKVACDIFKLWSGKMICSWCKKHKIEALLLLPITLLLIVDSSKIQFFTLLELKFSLGFWEFSNFHQTFYFLNL